MKKKMVLLDGSDVEKSSQVFSLEDLPEKTTESHSDYRFPEYRERN